MWRFHEVLPVNELSEAVSLGEGLTPFLKCVERGVFAGFGDLWLKDEGFNPTQSFKAGDVSGNDAGGGLWGTDRGLAVSG